MARKESLETDAGRLVAQLRATTEEIDHLEASLKGSPVLQEVRELERMLEAKRRGAIVFMIRSKYDTIDPGMFASRPYGNILAGVLTLAARMLK